MCAPLLSFVTSRPGLIKRLLCREALSTALQTPSCRYSTAHRPTLTKLPHSEEPFEEEDHPHYQAERFYNVQPGDLAKDGQYSIISKLGWGGRSTVWPAEDSHRPTDSKYVAINLANHSSEHYRKNQIELLQQVDSADPTHDGHKLVRTPEEGFEVQTEHGTHLCLVYPPLRMTLYSYRNTFDNRRLPLDLVKLYAYILLRGLDYLHSSAKIIHNDLKLQNILLTFEDDSVLEEAVERFKQSEHVYKETSSRRIFQTQDDFGPLRSHGIYPIISDFDVAEKDGYYAHPIQPVPYRAPEVILGWGWTNKADIWNFGHLVWALASGYDLFDGLLHDDGTYDAALHLAQMISVLGPPDPELVRQQARGYHCWLQGATNERGEIWNDANSMFGGPFFNAHSGECLQHDILIPPQSLESMVTGLEEARNFVDFLSPDACLGS